MIIHNRITPFRKSRISAFRVLCCKQGRNAGPEPELELPQLRKSFGTCKGCRSLSREPNGDFLQENKQEIYRLRTIRLKRTYPNHSSFSRKKRMKPIPKGCFFRDLPKHLRHFLDISKLHSKVGTWKAKRPGGIFHHDFSTVAPRGKGITMVEA